MDTAASDLSNAFSYVVSVITIGLIGFGCRNDIRNLVSARSVFLITILAWYMLEAWNAPAEIQKYSQAEYHAGLMAVFACIISFTVGYEATRGGVFDGSFRRLSTIDRPKLMWGIFVMSVIVGFFPLIILSKGNVLLILQDAFQPRQRWGSVFQRGRFGGARDAFLELQLFLRAALPLAAAILMHRKQPGSRRFVAILFLAFMSARACNDGTRSKVLEALMPVAAAIYWRMSAPAKRKALFFGLPAVSISATLWAAAAVSGRNAGQTDWDQATSVEYVGFEMFRELLYLQRMIPEAADYKFGHTYYVQLVNPIPRFLWPGKPTGDAGLELAGLRDSVANGADLTISPGLIGEMHWNGGWLGVIAISFFLGYVAKSWDRVRPLAKRSLLTFTIYAAGLAVIFLSGRAINMTVLYGIIAILLLLFFFAKPQKKNRRLPGRAVQAPHSDPGQI